MNTTDWRSHLRINQRRTYIVITLFFAMYLGLGVLIDLLMTMGNFVTPYGEPISVSQALHALISFQVFPYATVTAGMAAAIGLWVTYTFSDRMMLLGTQYHEVTSEASDLAERQL